MLEYPQWDNTDCRINATYDRIMARRQAEQGTETLPLLNPEPMPLHYGRIAAMTLVVLAMIMWRWGL